MGMTKLEKRHSIINQKLELISGDKNGFLKLCKMAANDNKYLLHDIKETHPEYAQLRNEYQCQESKKLRKKA